MSDWHRQNPELVGTDADPWMQHEEYRKALHHHRNLSDRSGPPQASPPRPEPPAGTGNPAGTSSIPSRRRTDMDCSNCGAPENLACQPWCIGEQYS